MVSQLIIHSRQFVVLFKLLLAFLLQIDVILFLTLNVRIVVSLTIGVLKVLCQQSAVLF